MASRDEENVRALFLQCAWLQRGNLTAQGRAEVEALLQPNIRQLLRFLADKLAARMSGGIWTADATSPGYLRRTSAGVDVYVPAHLFDDIPNDVVLEELLSLGAAIRTDGGALCLSGSSAVYGTLRYIGDCDFCEYLGGDSVDLRAAADAACAVSSSTVMALRISGWSNGGRWQVHRPWPTPAVSDDRAAKLEAIKGHYFGRTTFAGALEITKLMLPPQSWDRSHPAQELPTGWVPRTLDRPRNIEEYVTFLMGEVRTYARKNPVKGIKRAFSLARVLFLHDDAHAFLEVVRDSNALLRAAAVTRAEYARDLRTEYGTVPDDLRDHATMTAAMLFQQCVEDGGRTVSAEAMLAALQALPDEAGAAVSSMLERFVDEVDARIAQAVP